MRSRTATRSAPGTIDGVPPPTKIEVAQRHAGGDEPVGVSPAGREVGVGQVVAVRPRGERAVVAARRTERDVQVDTERCGRGHATIVALAGPMRECAVVGWT